MAGGGTDSGGKAPQERFDLWRQRSGFVLAPLTCAAVWLAPTGLEEGQHRLAAVLAAVIVLWVTEAIPMAMTAFLGVAAAVLLGVAAPREAFAPFADPLIFVFIGTFMIAQSIFYHRLDRRFAFSILSLPGIAGRPGRVLAAYAVGAAALSMWISNTATTAMMFPIGVSLLHSLESLGGRRAIPPAYGSALLLSTSFAASVGGLGTPVGTPPNLIGLGFIRREVGVDLPFFSWMALGIPVVAVLLVWMVWRLSRSARGVEGSAEIGALVAAEYRALGPWTRGQVNTMVAFATTVALWVAPGLAAILFGQGSEAARGLRTLLPESVVALLGAGLLFVLPTRLERHEFTLPWEEAVKIDWWIVFLYGGGIALGTLAFQTGLAEALGRALTDTLGVRSEIGLLALSTAIATVLSETTSNTASANMVVPVVIAFARSSGIDPVLPAVGATMGASLGFMMPVSTPCNAIVYGSGRIPLRTMMRYGLLLDAVGVIAIVAVVGLLGPLVLNRAG
jgi:solute carrier family 13 (sodium-dependent dicarboxylate transporter), member 2/3/5